MDNDLSYLTSGASQPGPTKEIILNAFKSHDWTHATGSNVADVTGFTQSTIRNFFTHNSDLFKPSVLPEKNGEKFYFIVDPKHSPLINNALDWWNAFGYLNSAKLGKDK